MFASIMLILAGVLGTLFALLIPIISFGVACPDASAAPSGSAPAASGESLSCSQTWIPAWMKEYPWWLQLGLGLATATLGFLMLRRHQRIFGYAGAVTAVASLGFVGFVPVLGIIAVAFLVKAGAEGEDLTGGKPMDSSDWPDKALASSLFLLVSGVLALGWGILILTGASNPVLLSDMPWLEGSFDIAAALWCAYAAWQVYHLQRAWTGFVGIVLAALTFGLYVVAPVLAGVALVLLLMARREDEFEPTAA